MGKRTLAKVPLTRFHAFFDPARLAMFRVAPEAFFGAPLSD
jgi:hypothetical protein